MKKIIILTLLLAFGTTSFCQQTVQKHSLTKTDYLLKSKKQKKIAWIFLGGGVAVAAVGAIIPKGELTGEISYPCLCEDVHENDDIKAGFILAGAVSALGSIPFFIASGKNKRRAMQASVFIHIEKVPVLQSAGISSRSFPALGMKIGI
jgi:hypothetical protein